MGQPLERVGVQAVGKSGFFLLWVFEYEVIPTYLSVTSDRYVVLDAV